MIQLKVLVFGVSPVEALNLEEFLRQSGCLQRFRNVSLEMAFSQVPEWESWDLIIARFVDAEGAQLLALLAPVLRKNSPPVIFLVDRFQANIVNSLMNYGARRVLPAREYETLLLSAVETIFRIDLPPVPPKPSNVLGQLISPNLKKLSLLDRVSNQNEDIATLFAHSSIGICILKIAEGTCLDCNEGFAHLLDCPREELIGHVVPELGLTAEMLRLPAAGDQRPGQAMREMKRQFTTRERKVCTVNIELDWVNWRGKECVVVIAQDITEIERDKQKIKRLNDQLERLVVVRTGALNAANRELAAEIDRRKYLEDYSRQLSQTLRETSDIVAIGDSEGNLQFLNSAGRSLFGIGEEDPIDHLNLFFPYSEETRKRIKEEVQPVLMEQGSWRGEAEFTLPDGRIIPISQVMICKKDDEGNILYYATIARDVSDFKRVELELRQSRERYRTLAESAHDFIFMVSKNGLMEYANAYACQALGHDPIKVEGIPASQFFPREFAINHLQKFSEVHEVDRPLYTEGPFFWGEDQLWMGTWLVPIHDENGNLVSVLGISRDITEQKKADEALERALQNERRLGESRANFFSMTSHQFRTPLSTILLSVGLLQKYSARLSEQERSEYFARIEEAARRLSKLLDDILAIGRVDYGRYTCKPKRFDLIAFIERVIGELSSNDASKHSFQFHCQQQEYYVFLDPDVFHRIMDNLLSNAIKYSPAGSEVSVTLSAENAHFSLEVIDQGIGIPEEDMQYLFQPFQRGSNAASYPGTGIGLMIIQKSVELMKGSISVKSHIGQGTTFTVRLPVQLDTFEDTIGN